VYRRRDADELNHKTHTNMRDITIKSTHSTLEAAIEAAGGLNRGYNPKTFDKAVARTKRDASKQAFYVVERLGRDIVLYHYDCDIRLINEFSPFSGCVSNTTQIGWLGQNDISNVQAIANTDGNRKKAAKLQKEYSDFFVLNF
jgi:hypothetical protein